MQVKLKVTKRAARLSFVPAFIMEYQYGEVFDPHGHRKPYLFQAIISGVQNYQVAAERHVSPWKVTSDPMIVFSSCNERKTTFM